MSFQVAKHMEVLEEYLPRKGKEAPGPSYLVLSTSSFAIYLYP
jgi:hypothetical protein